MNALSFRIPDYPIMDDDRLYKFCVYNREMKIERSSQGEITVMSPTGGESSSKNGTIFFFLKQYQRKVKTGKVFDSSGGFVLPNKAMRSPDAAWISTERWETLTAEEKRKFPPLCPEFVIELLSESDDLYRTKKKMEEWMENGCRLGWLIDPFQKNVYIYKEFLQMKTQGFDMVLSGEDILPGFELPLNELDD
ncbi:MAG TPA: Uma2 family endonuclease [Leptospiraceae bacterium]|nr:Uma2 family endonuclease [Leptospiraceae bacterium]HMZ59359.1 Uma2 family endonuclease [Leptospiraceae bacterium]HNF26786.1 Uma2 family endonuclease [Leptospiraceae bacterium]HNI26185.1 Uma2 family endonuclease [Leptospiraceae bacterium]HNI99406.1 Uma2 family endonuclease [Leptospiraceae bacterium]